MPARMAPKKQRTKSSFAGQDQRDAVALPAGRAPGARRRSGRSRARSRCTRTRPRSSPLRRAKPGTPSSEMKRKPSVGSALAASSMAAASVSSEGKSRVAVTASVSLFRVGLRNRWRQAKDAVFDSTLDGEVGEPVVAIHVTTSAGQKRGRRGFVAVLVFLRRGHLETRTLRTRRCAPCRPPIRRERTGTSCR